MNPNGLVPYQDRFADLAVELSERGSFAMLVIDLGLLSAVEDEYGSDVYDEVRGRVVGLLAEQRGKDYRTDDVVVMDKPGGLRFVFFLDHKRRRTTPVSTAEVRAMHHRLLSTLVPHLTRAAFPYVKGAVRGDMGYAVAVHNPLVSADRTFRRAYREALETAGHLKNADRLQMREKLLDVLLRERVVTAFQPIMRIFEGGPPLAYEALSRGPRGSGLENPEVLFGAASEHGLVIELDRLCRRRALLSACHVSSAAKVFVNTLPATIRDPQFRGRPLIEFLDRAQVAPDRIVLEITEKLVIENYGLFRETMAYFTALGMAFAVDDVGSGYSGLESIARLKPAFLKIDTGLVRDVHASLVHREMVKAIVAMGHGIGSTVIAEGIESPDEAQALRDMGVDYGQGFFLARPELVGVTE